MLYNEKVALTMHSHMSNGFNLDITVENANGCNI